MRDLESAGMPLDTNCGARLHVPGSPSWITVTLYISQVWMYGWVWTLLFTPIVWASTEAAHSGGSRSSGGSRLPLSNYCGDRKVSRRAIPSWERCASRLQHPTHKPVISALVWFVILAVISFYEVNNHVESMLSANIFLWSCCHVVLRSTLWGALEENMLLKLSSAYWDCCEGPLTALWTWELFSSECFGLVYCFRASFCNGSLKQHNKKAWLPSWVPGSPSHRILSSAL